MHALACGDVLFVAESEGASRHLRPVGRLGACGLRPPAAGGGRRRLLELLEGEDNAQRDVSKEAYPLGVFFDAHGRRGGSRVG